MVIYTNLQEFCFEIFSYLRFVELLTMFPNGHLSPNDITNFPIPLPPLPIQKEIAEHITNIRQQAKTLQNEAKAAIEEAKRTVKAMILG